MSIQPKNMDVLFFYFDTERTMVYILYNKSYSKIIKHRQFMILPGKWQVKSSSLGSRLLATTIPNPFGLWQIFLLLLQPPRPTLWADYFMHTLFMLHQTIFWCEKSTTQFTCEGFLSGMASFMGFQSFFRFYKLWTKSALELRALMNPLMWTCICHWTEALSTVLAAKSLICRVWQYLVFVHLLE